MSTRQTRVVLVCVALMLGHASAAFAAEPPPASKLAFEPGTKGEYTFDTGAFAGVLRRGGTSMGLVPVMEAATKTQVAGGYGGIFAFYRILTSEARYGTAAWEWPSTSKLLPDGAVAVEWPAEEKRPVVLRGVYRWAGADTLDLDIEARAEAALPKFDVFLASYFAGFPGSFIYVKQPPGAKAAPGFMEAKKAAGEWQAFPRDDAAAALVQERPLETPAAPGAVDDHAATRRPAGDAP